MRRNKHQWFCGACHSPVFIFKKGHNHRVMVCHNCGVIAYNGIGGLIAGASSLIGGPIGIAGKIAGGLIDKTTSRKSDVTAQGEHLKPTIIRQPILVDIK